LFAIKALLPNNDVPHD